MSATRGSGQERRSERSSNDQHWKHLHGLNEQRDSDGWALGNCKGTHRNGVDKLEYADIPGRRTHEKAHANGEQRRDGTRDRDVEMCCNGDEVIRRDL